MTAVLFVGPSLPASDLANLDGFTCLPPVAQGDLHKVALSRPRAIGIIDGYFQGVPAVWHKEILWAMSQGIHVFGAASMGALRAAELHAFGMRGVGRVFEAYRDGVLIDDDEVAVLHGPSETGYVTVSEPMVNVRATLEQAVTDGVVCDAVSAQLEALAKQQFYHDRTWQSVLKAAEGNAPDGDLARLQHWLPGGLVDQKRADALAMIAAMSRHLESDPDPMTVDFSFEYTEMWAGAPWLSGTETAAELGKDNAATIVLNELRLEDTLWFSVQERALLAALACGEIVADDAPPDRHVVMRELNAFRLEHGLGRMRDVEVWAHDHGTDIAGVERIVTERARMRELARANAGRLDRRILDQLRLSGDFARLLVRGQRKADILGEGGSGDKTSRQPERMLLESHFKERLGRDMPDDIEEYAADIGLEAVGELLNLLQCEAKYLMMSPIKSAEG